MGPTPAALRGLILRALARRLIDYSRRSGSLMAGWAINALMGQLGLLGMCRLGLSPAIGLRRQSELGPLLLQEECWGLSGSLCIRLQRYQMSGHYYHRPRWLKVDVATEENRQLGVSVYIAFSW